MPPKKSLNIAFLILAVIIGRALFKHTDFQNLTFKKPALDTIYLITFVTLVILLVRDYAQKPAE